jgi:hypothetical protein
VHISSASFYINQTRYIFVHINSDSFQIRAYKLRLIAYSFNCLYNHDTVHPFPYIRAHCIFFHTNSYSLYNVHTLTYTVFRLVIIWSNTFRLIAYSYSYTRTHFIIYHILSDLLHIRSHTLRLIAYVLTYIQTYSLHIRSQALGLIANLFTYRHTHCIFVHKP